MVITEEESNKIKEHLLKQLSNFPADKREQIKEQISSMTPEEIENFVQQNSLTHLGGQCIFCSIVSGKTPAVKIGEDDSNLAVLELNPLSKGHTLIIPFNHSEGKKDSSKRLADKISREITNKFSPKNIQTNELEIMGHKLFELIPIYGNEKERKQATEKELRQIQKEILEPPKIKEVKKEVKNIEPLPRFPARIP